MKDGLSRYYDEAVEPGKRERAYAWATAIGLQDVDGLKPSKYLLKTARRHIEGEISQEEARRIVDEYYETKDGHDLPADMQEADKVAARICSEYAVPSAAAVAGVHRRGKKLDIGSENLILADKKLILMRFRHRRGRISRNCKMPLARRNSSSAVRR